MEYSDPLLLDKKQKCDIVTFSRLFDEVYATSCFFVKKHLCDLDLLRSLVQHIFLDLWTKCERPNIRSSAKSYLFCAVKNRFIDCYIENKEVQLYK